ncbi:MAG: hydroxymethylglutaryl-CoA reductase, degradative [Woeseiaceae bacterium]
MKDSRLAGLYKLPIAERIRALQRQGWLSATDAERLTSGRQVLSPVAADKITENVVGVFGLPFSIAPNFLINGEDRMVPLVVEEPSIVAALSGAARLARKTGGFTARCEESLLAGQIHVTGTPDPAASVESLRAAKDAILEQANAVHPRLVKRGGGARDMEVRLLALPDGAPLIAVHLLVDTVDAMGANLVNTLCEAVAPRVADVCKGRAVLRILSNLADRSIVTATARFAVEDLGNDEFSGAQVRDAIVLANDIAFVDAHRATTHNKGVMNGVDALAIATGNDWRAIEAGAHAYAARDGQYRPLTRWQASATGDLVGEIVIPLKVGTVGGTLDANPAASLGLAVTGTTSARDLALLMAAVGLAQNFAALRALVSSGIQEGHMKLHARSVAAAAGAPEADFAAVVARLIDSGEVKSWKAKEILGQLRATKVGPEVPMGRAAGKVILFGEHAAVYGRHALAVPLVDAVSASVQSSSGGTSLAIPAWGVERDLDHDNATGIDAAIGLILKRLQQPLRNYAIHVNSALPPGMGLGASAALAVAVTRAFCKYLDIDINDERVNEIAFDCEKLAHGTPSGVDNTISTYAKPMLFRNEGSLQTQWLTLPEMPPLLIASSHETGLTSEQVAGVRRRYGQSPARYGAIFDEIDGLSLAGAELLQARNYDELGLLMNICHGLLNAIEVSTPQLEHIVALARQAGAAGAKLTGGGGGGSVVALCPVNLERVQDALQQAGYRVMVLKQ